MATDLPDRLSANPPGSAAQPPGPDPAPGGPLPAAMPRPTVLLFDWDNTLVDGWAAITAALNVVFA